MGMGSTFSFEIVNQSSCDVGENNLVSEENALSDIVLMEKLDKYQTRQISSWKDKKEQSTCKCNRILVVDDVGTNIFAIQCILKQFGLESDSATNGKMALQLIENRVNHEKPCGDCCKARQKGYELIFMDINMPVMDGHEAMQNIKKKMD